MTAACALNWPMAAVLVACALSITCMVVAALMQPTVALPLVSGAPASPDTGGSGVVGKRAVPLPRRAARTTAPTSKDAER